MKIYLNFFLMRILVQCCLFIFCLHPVTHLCPAQETFHPGDLLPSLVPDQLAFRFFSHLINGSSLTRIFLYSLLIFSKYSRSSLVLLSSPRLLAATLMCLIHGISHHCLNLADLCILPYNVASQVNCFLFFLKFSFDIGIHYS